MRYANNSNYKNDTMIRKEVRSVWILSIMKGVPSDRTFISENIALASYIIFFFVI